MAREPTWLSHCYVIGCQFELTTTDVTVDSNPFALRFCRDPRRRESFIKELAGAYSRYSADDHVDEPSRWCAVHDSANWWRAEVLSCKRDKLGFVTNVNVLYIDRGVEEVVPIENVFPLDDKFLDDPPFNICATVKGLRVDAAKLRDLFETHPKAKIRIRMNSTTSGKRLYVTPTSARIAIGYDDWIDLEKLCTRLKIGEFDDDALRESSKSGQSSLRNGPSDTSHPAISHSKFLHHSSIVSNETTLYKQNAATTHGTEDEMTRPPYCVNAAEPIVDGRPAAEETRTQSNTYEKSTILAFGSTTQGPVAKESINCDLPASCPQRSTCTEPTDFCRPKVNIVQDTVRSLQNEIRPKSRTSTGDHIGADAFTTVNKNPTNSCPSSRLSSLQTRLEPTTNGVVQNNVTDLSATCSGGPLVAHCVSMGNGDVPTMGTAGYPNRVAEDVFQRGTVSESDDSSQHSFETAASSCISEDEDDLQKELLEEEYQSGLRDLIDFSNGNSSEEDPNDNYIQHKRNTERRIKRTIQQAEIAKQRNERATRPCLAFTRYGNCPLGDVCPFLHHGQESHQTVVHGSSHTMREFPEFELSISETMFMMVFNVDDTFALYVVPVYGHRSIWDVMEHPDRVEVSVKTIRDRLGKKYDPLLTKKNVKGQKLLTEGLMIAVWLGSEGRLAGWHRGKLIGIDSAHKSVDIFLVDYGRQVRAPTSCVFPLENEFFEYPRQAIRCTLTGGHPVPHTSREALLQRLQDQLFIVYVNELSTITDIKVDLFTSCDAGSVLDQLVDEGLFSL